MPNQLTATQAKMYTIKNTVHVYTIHIEQMHMVEDTFFDAEGNPVTAYRKQGFSKTFKIPCKHNNMETSVRNLCKWAVTEGLLLIPDDIDLDEATVVFLEKVEIKDECSEAEWLTMRGYYVVECK